MRARPLLSPVTALGAKLRAESEVPVATRILAATEATGPFIRYTLASGEEQEGVYAHFVLTVEYWHPSLQSAAEMGANRARQVILGWGERNGPRTIELDGETFTVKRTSAGYPVELPTTDGRQRFIFTAQVWVRH